MADHLDKVVKLQEQMKSCFAQKDAQQSSSAISLESRSGYSNTIRSKSYKKECRQLELNDFSAVLQIDPKRGVAIVEPRVTMEELIKATLRYGLIPPVVPEFKGITVGGAIMGGAGESGSHRWGGFNDICLSFEILCGDGTVINASPSENSDIFYGISCSYGSLGILLSAEILLIPVHDSVLLQYHICSSPKEGIRLIQELMHSSHPPDFLDGIVFSKDLCVIMKGTLTRQGDDRKEYKRFSMKPVYSEWYFQHVEKIGLKSKTYEEIIPVQDYLFRYDQGAFWVGSYLFRPQFFIPFIFQGILKITKYFNDSRMQTRLHAPRPNVFLRTFLHPIMKSQNLWKLHHLAEKWMQNQFIIQDFCIPEEKASQFLEEVIRDLGIFPLWLCPIKSTCTPQIFAPHFTKNNTLSHFINIGIYGLPSHSASTKEMTRILEQKTKTAGGRKVLYSRSYYSQEEFWEIYPRHSYDLLRKKMLSDRVLHDITKKVLSE